MPDPTDIPAGSFTSRREFLKASAALPFASVPHSTPIAAFFSSSTPNEPNRPGAWSVEADLPVYTYTGPLRFGRPAYLPDDPYFLLGNHRLTLFAHASGQLQLLSGERAWGRLNQGPSPWSGMNAASVAVDGQRTELIGVESEAALHAEKRFGVGFAEYTYTLPSGLRVQRTLSIAPSARTGEGSSAFVCTVHFRNTGPASRPLLYREEMGAAYAQIFASFDRNHSAVRYVPRCSQEGDSVRCDFTPEAAPFRLLAGADGSSPFETVPPSLFVAPLHASAHGDALRLSAVETAGQPPHLSVSAAFDLAPGGERSLDFVIGYTREGSRGIAATVEALRSASQHEAAAPFFRTSWNHLLPPFSGESDPDLRREMRWHAAMLEQMATWKERYDETVVPQGMTYDYEWGRMLSSRDWAQHALPLCTTHPALARSVLRFLLKRIHPDGEVELNEQGFGWDDSGAMHTSDQQLFFFLLLNEYLRATEDWSVLQETVPFFPAAHGGEGTGLAHVQSAFLFLRDRIGTGEHGLVRLWNSDWNDLFYFWPTSMPYNQMFDAAESHMNTAMAIVVLGDLASHLERAPEREVSSERGPLTGALRAYRARLLQAFLHDWGTRPFPRRAYLGGARVAGENDMWLEPQGYTLLIPELSAERKRALFAEIDRRLLRGEAMGARQIESPTPQGSTPPGTRENGGFWYALHGPLVLGVSTFDRRLAEDLLQRFTLARYGGQFPNYWVGQWTAADSLDSSLTSTEGLSSTMTCCAHAHAWPLYTYLRLRGVRGAGSARRSG